jgi:hypothetical protein
MEIIIDFDDIDNASKKEWLINTLNLMGIGYHTTKQTQMLDQYNQDLIEGDKEIENGDFITAEELKKEISTW